MEREKVTLCYVIRFRMQWKMSDLLVFSDICESIIRENVASSVGVQKKAINFSFIEKKNSNCANTATIKDEKIQKFLLYSINVINACACDTAGCALNTLNFWKIRRCSGVPM